MAFTAIGQSLQLAAEVLDQARRAMADVQVSWSSADTTAAAVDSAGLVTAAGRGTTTITATASEASGEAVVTVMQSTDSVVVTPTAYTIAPADTLRLAAEAFDENGHRVDGAAFNWSSSDVSVARVDSSGLVTAVAEGRTTITAAAGDAQGASEITVENLDRAALVALYNATDGPNWVNNDNWLTDAPLGEWYGVDTDASGRVARLNLNGNVDRGVSHIVSHGLTGRMPPELGNLTALQELSLRFNGLFGAIPGELGNLTGLEHLYLDYNDLTGAIPRELGKLTKLVDLYLGQNELSGPIPVEFAELQRLRNVFLPGSICIPDELIEWAVDRSISALPCNSGGRLLPSALMREDGNGLSVALPDDLREPSALTVSDPGVVAVAVSDGWLELVPRGRGTAKVGVVPSGGGDPAHARVVVRAAVGSFGIDVVMERPAPVTYERALIVAADWWSGVLDGTEWPDRRPTCFDDRATAVADELLFHARIDPDAVVAGYAQTCFRSSGQQVALDPGGGRVVVNPSSANPFLVQHEMGHLLGLVLVGPGNGARDGGPSILRRPPGGRGLSRQRRRCRLARRAHTGFALGLGCDGFHVTEQ